MQQRAVISTKIKAVLSAPQQYFIMHHEKSFTQSFTDQYALLQMQIYVWQFAAKKNLLVTPTLPKLLIIIVNNRNL